MARIPIPVNKAVVGELIADVREVAFYHLATESMHRGEILRGASVVELFQNDPAELFAGHNPAPLFVIPPLQVIQRSRHSPDRRFIPPATRQRSGRTAEHQLDQLFRAQTLT